VHITTVPITLQFLRGQSQFMRRFGISTEAITSSGEGVAEFARSESVTVHQVEMTRRVSPIRDLAAIARLVALLRKISPHVVHAHTPKAGLLGTIASRLAGVPVTIYHLHGLPLVTATGLKHRLLQWSDQLACGLSDSVLCVGPSVRKLALANRLCRPDKAKVLLAGSINGVDATGRFDPAGLVPGTREATRAEFGIPADALVVGYLGRLVADKGICELIEAWSLVSGNPRLHLLLVGPFEPQDPLSPDTEQVLRSDSRIHLAGLRWDPPRCLAAMDVVVLPTYREGLPVVPLEAGAMGLPVVATNIPGCLDAIEDGVTGMLVPPRDAAALARAIGRYLDDTALRVTHGAAGRARVLLRFRPEAMWEALLAEYRSLLGASGVRLPGG
jgi:glycosyltransferase involved in cell wall biosynthesis